MSFVWGDDNIDFLKKRQQAMVQHPLFYGMEYSEDHAKIKQWAPLMIEGRDPAQKIAATYMPLGTDVNHGAWTQQLMASLQKTDNFQLHLQSEVTALRQNADKTWNVTVADLANNRQEKPSRPSSCSWVPVAPRSNCCRPRASLSPRTTPASPWVASSWPSRTPS